MHLLILGAALVIYIQPLESIASAEACSLDAAITVLPQHGSFVALNLAPVAGPNIILHTTELIIGILIELMERCTPAAHVQQLFTHTILLKELKGFPQKELVLRNVNSADSEVVFITS